MKQPTIENARTNFNKVKRRIVSFVLGKNQRSLIRSGFTNTNTNLTDCTTCNFHNPLSVLTPVNRILHGRGISPGLLQKKSLALQILPPRLGLRSISEEHLGRSDQRVCSNDEICEKSKIFQTRRCGAQKEGYGKFSNLFKALQPAS